MHQLPRPEAEYSVAGERMMAFGPEALPEGMAHPREFFQTVVEVGGVPYEVTGVEVYQIADGVPYHLSFGLRVEAVQTGDAQPSPGG